MGVMPKFPSEDLFWLFHIMGVRARPPRPTHKHVPGSEITDMENGGT